MGIKGLGQFLKQFNNIVTLDEISNKTIAIDIYV